MNSKVNTKDISELRSRSGAGVVDCKKALQEAQGDLEKASEILRQKGLASAVKKAGKIAAEGAVATCINDSGDKGIILELNCQTDFVSMNEKFKDLLEKIVSLAMQNTPSSLEELKKLKISDGAATIEELIAEKTGEIGEKIDLRRFQLITAAEGERVFGYTHPIGSKVAVLCKIKGEKSSELGKDLTMHIAAVQPAPEFLKESDIAEEIFIEEKRIEMGKDDLANKPAEIKDKIIEGRVRKSVLQRVLLEQDFIKDGNKKIKDLLQENSCQIISFTRFDLGEGVERKQENFAEEVAAQTQK